MPNSEFPHGAQNYLRAISANNNRDWFHANKSHYESAFKNPAAVFAASVAQELSDVTGSPIAAKTYRINRDLRFSKDKTPYNTHLRIGFRSTGGTGKSDMEVPGFFFSLEPNHYVIGAGVFQLSGPSLDKFRQAVDAEATGKALADLVSSQSSKGFRLNDADLKQVPRGFDKQHPRADLLCRKGISLMTDLDLNPAMATSTFTKQCLANFKSLLPLYTWIADNVVEGND